MEKKVIITLNDFEIEMLVIEAVTDMFKKKEVGQVFSNSRIDLDDEDKTTVTLCAEWNVDIWEIQGGDWDEILAESSESLIDIDIEIDNNKNEDCIIDKDCQSKIFNKLIKLSEK